MEKEDKVRVLNRFLTLWCLLLFVATVPKIDGNVCNTLQDCGSCLRSSQPCVWCADETWLDGTDQSRFRCDLEGSRCENRVEINGSVIINDSVSSKTTTQVRPQKASVILRINQSISFSVKIRPAKDFPVSLYYLMDMSKSMADDLSTLKRLSKDIANELKNLTSKFKLAFGAFVDKTVAPFVRMENLQNEPCVTEKETNKSYVKTFGYKHIFDFNEDAKLFQNAINELTISRNKDIPEGTLDALMQVAACIDRLKWPKNERRIVVLATDAPPHIALDGKLGGILIKNDAKCRVDAQGVYNHSNILDYPTFFQVKQKLKQNNIIPIFAAGGFTDSSKGIYKLLTNQWADIGASYGELTRNSSNIVALIRRSYQNISQTVRLTNEPVDGLTVSYTPKKCRNSDGDSVCRDVGIKEEVEFAVTVNARNCPLELSEWDQTKNLRIVIPGFGDIDVDVKLICECPCEKTGGIKDSLKCNGTGTFQCGICYCNEGRYGERCECDGFTKTDTSTCKASNETEEVCSGMGNCICGKCVCDKRNSAKEIINGTFCECNNFECIKFKNRLCGGSERGHCQCGRCMCNKEYFGDNCGEINRTITDEKCFSADGTECNGNGECDYGQCICKKGFEGKYCKNCISCPEKCEEKKDCVLCLFRIGEKEVCDGCVDFDYRFVNETEEQCAYQVNERCYIIYNFEQNLGKNDTVIVRREKRCQTSTTPSQNLLLIVLSTTGSITMAGVIFLVSWKLVVTAYDRFEYQRFERERMTANWSENQNPLYMSSQQQYVNPAYSDAQ